GRADDKTTAIHPVPPQTDSLAASALNAANSMHRSLDALGVLVPEFRERSLIKERDLIANIIDGGFELVAGCRFLDGVAQHPDDRCRRIFRSKHADPQRELDVISLLFQRGHIRHRCCALRTEAGERTNLAGLDLSAGSRDR